MYELGTVPNTEYICFNDYSFYYNFNQILNWSVTQKIKQHSSRKQHFPWFCEFSSYLSIVNEQNVPKLALSTAANEHSVRFWG